MTVSELFQSAVFIEHLLGTRSARLSADGEGLGAGSTGDG